MPCRAVIFDLFGTLVNGFTRKDYDQVNAQMAAAVRVPYTEFWRLMGETYRDSCLGRYITYEDLVADVCARWRSNASDPNYTGCRVSFRIHRQSNRT